jgi:hypothetical protein
LASRLAFTIFKISSLAIFAPFRDYPADTTVAVNVCTLDPAVALMRKAVNGAVKTTKAFEASAEASEENHVAAVEMKVLEPL